MSRTPYSPFVEKAMAPVPWNAGRLLRVRCLGYLGVRRVIGISDLAGRD
jgi:hypothetical protein